MHHLGITVNTAAGVFEVPREKLRMIRRLAVDLRVTAKKNHRLVLKRELAKFCGFAQSVKGAAVPPHDEGFRLVGLSRCQAYIGPHPATASRGGAVL